jgi:hypothetical protein
MNKIWFKRKRYGWGWYPVSWQGWVVVLVYAGILSKFFIFYNIKDHSVSDFLINMSVPFIILSSILIIICYKKGETPKWQWGNKPVDK